MRVHAEAREEKEKAKRLLHSPRAWHKRIWEGLLSEHASPPRLGAAIGVGIFVGFTPLFGLHFWICLALAFLLRLNKVAMYLGANITNPLFALPIIFASVQAGNLVLTGSFLPISRHDFQTTALMIAFAKKFLAAWFVGASILGAAVGALGGVVTWRVLLARQRQQGHELAGARDRAARRIASGAKWPKRLWIRGYAEAKYRHDPVCGQCGALLPERGTVVDVGCGVGLLLFFLAEAKPNLTLIGLDWDGKKIEMARRAGRGAESPAFVAGDVRNLPIPLCDAIVCLDVLHYMPSEDQDALLVRAAASLRSTEAVLILRECDAAPGLRGLLSRISERIGIALGLHRADRLVIRPRGEIVSVLEAAGLEVRRIPSPGRSVFANALLLAKRRSSG